MESIRQYLLSVVSAAILCGIVTGIIGKKSAYGSIVKLISGLVLAMTVISPWAKLEIVEFSNYTDSLSNEANNAVSNGETMAQTAMASIIMEQTEAYILDKAESMGLDISVEVTLSDTDPPIPQTVSIAGTISPYAKEVLSNTIEDNLGVSKEDQKWI